MKQEIPIFFSTDDAYIPFLAVAIESLIANSSKEYDYKIKILNSKIKEKNIEKIKLLEKDNIRIEFISINKKVKEIEKKLNLRLRDYYSISIYYRMFISSLFKNYDKAIYLDADVVLVDDIAKLYNTKLNNDILGVVVDETVAGNEIFKNYVEEVVGVKADRYFNSGILVMNLKKFREEKIEEKFLYLLDKYNFETIAPDQDYLNVLCKDKVTYMNKGWDKMPEIDKDFNDEDLHLIHFNMFQKPWHYSDVPYESYFWKYAKNTDFYDYIVNIKNNYSEEDKLKDKKAGINLLKVSEKICTADNTFKNVIIDNYFEKIKENF